MDSRYTISSLCRTFQKFRHDTSGSATIEFVLWVPMFFFMVMFALDAALLMSDQTYMWTVASDASRSVAMGQLTAAEAETWVADNSFNGQTYTVDVSVTGQTVRTSVSVPWSEAAFTPWMRELSNTMSVVATHRVEPTL